MPVFQGSRYQFAAILRITAADQQQRPTIYWRPTFPSNTSFFYHTVGVGERMDNLAHQYYSDSTLWWIIANANPEVWYPDALDPGTMIRIPVNR